MTLLCCMLSYEMQQVQLISVTSSSLGIAQKQGCLLRCELFLNIAEE